MQNLNCKALIILIDERFFGFCTLFLFYIVAGTLWSGNEVGIGQEGEEEQEQEREVDADKKKEKGQEQKEHEQGGKE